MVDELGLPMSELQDLYANLYARLYGVLSLERRLGPGSARWPSLAAFEREEMANANGATRAGEFADERSNSSAGAAP